MTGPLDRRQSMAWLAGAALVPLLASARPARARPVSARQAANAFNPPSTPMRLTRELSRELGDGAHIVVQRIWQVQFTDQDAGFSLEGEQVGVDVSAPQSLGMLAAIERGRTENAMFPIALDQYGLITAEQADGAPAQIDQAILQARRQIDAARLSDAKQADARQFLAYLQQSAAQLASQLPEDLFNPAQSNWQQRREIDLPHGQSGSVSVTFSAATDPAGHLMQRAQRCIVTQIGDASRTSCENWSLLPA